MQIAVRTLNRLFAVDRSPSIDPLIGLLRALKPVPLACRGGKRET